MDIIVIISVFGVGFGVGFGVEKIIIIATQAVLKKLKTQG